MSSLVSSRSGPPTSPRGSIVYIVVLARLASRVSSDSSEARSAAANSLPPFENGLLVSTVSPFKFVAQLLESLEDPSQLCPVMLEKRWLASLARDFENGSKS